MDNPELHCSDETQIFCGKCVNCIEWDSTFDCDSFEEKKRARIAEENEY